MFLKTGELKKVMKASLKGAGLTVGSVDGTYLVYGTGWGVSVDQNYASNKFKAAIMELIGDIPEREECCVYKLSSENQIEAGTVADYPDAYENWKEARDCAVMTPLSLYAWPHEYLVCQRKSDRKFLAVNRALVHEMISPKELDSEVEAMPGRPSIQNGSTLYYKNETTIYWVDLERCGERAEEVLFPRLKGMDFFENDWMLKENPESEESENYENGAGEEQLPY